MEKHVLSKSTFIRGVQCLKSLYLNQKRPFLRDKLPRERLLVFRRGHEVGDLALQLFPGGVNMRPGHPSAYRKSLAETREHIEKGTKVIYEAAFQHDGILIFLDILVRSGDSWSAYEVKSSGGISDTYLMDAALQYHVITGCGIELDSISIIHIDKSYVLDGELEPSGLFSILDVTEEALSRQKFVRDHILREKETLDLKNSPSIDVGPHCREPYDCDFIGHCWKKVAVPEPPPIEEQLDHGMIGRFAGTDPVFIKLLTIRPAIPMYQASSPYQEIAYAYAILRGDRLTTRVFDHAVNPELSLKDALQADLENAEAVICINNKWKVIELAADRPDVCINIDEMFRNNPLFTNEGESLVGKISHITGSELHEIFSSDAVCAHHYLNNSKGDEGWDDIRMYAQSLVEASQKLYEYISKISRG